LFTLLRVPSTQVRVTSPLATNVDIYEPESKRASVASNNSDGRRSVAAVPTITNSWTAETVPVSNVSSVSSTSPIRKTNGSPGGSPTSTPRSSIPVPKKLAVNTTPINSQGQDDSPAQTSTAYEVKALGQKNKDKVSLASTAPTPTFTSPKRSWFANLFNFKPESFTFVTKKQSTFEETVDTLVHGFGELNIKYQVRREGAFRCKLDIPAAPAAESASTNTNQPVGQQNGAPSQSSQNHQTIRQDSRGLLSPSALPQPRASASGQSSAASAKAVKFKVDVIPYDSARPNDSESQSELFNTQGSSTNLSSSPSSSATTTTVATPSSPSKASSASPLKNMFGKTQSSSFVYTPPPTTPPRRFKVHFVHQQGKSLFLLESTFVQACRITNLNSFFALSLTGAFSAFQNVVNHFKSYWDIHHH
jgi:hypothetical protein